MKNRLRQELEAMLEHTGDSFTADNVHTLVNGIFAADEGGGFEYVEYDDNAFPYPQTIGSTALSISGLGPADESMINTIFIMPNKSTNPDATLMIVVDEVTPETTPKTYQYVYVGNINNLPSDVLTESSIVNDLSTGGTDKPLSAEQGRTLNSHVNYATCGSGSADQVKLISDDGFELSTHLRLLVMMTNTNTNSTPKFNINNTGVKDVWYNGSVASDINTWATGEVLDVYYDGTKYIANTHGGAQFSTGEKVGDVGIDDEPTFDSNNLVKSGGVYEEVLQLKAKLKGIDAHEEKLTTFATTPGAYTDDGTFSNYLAMLALCTEVAIPQECKVIRFLGLALRSELSDADSNIAYVFGHYNGSTWVTDYVKRFDKNTENTTITKEYAVKVPLSSTHFRTEVRYSNKLILSNFYCYFGFGDTVKDFVDGQTNEIHSELSLISHNPNVTANKRLAYDRVNRVHEEIVTPGWCVSNFVKIPEGTTSITWYNGMSGDVKGMPSTLCVYADKNEESYITYYSNTETPRTISLKNFPTAKYVRASFIMGYDDAKLVDVFGNVFFIVDLSNGDLESAENKIESLQSYNEWKEYPLTSDIQQGSRIDDNWTPIQATTSCRLECITLVPYDDARYKILMPYDYAMRFHYGNIISQQNQGNSTVIGTFYNGDEFDVPEHNANLTMVFYHVGLDTTTIPSTVAQLIAEGKIKLLYKSDNSVSVQAKNQGSDRFAKTAIYKFNNTALDSYVGNIPAIGHFSDLHGDIVRLRNMMEYLQWLGVDVIVNTGDTVANKASNGMSFYHNEVKNYGIPTLITIGNHDVWYADTSLSGHTQNELSYEDVIEPNSTLFGYTLPTSSYYDDAPTYYYKDLTDKKLRIIVLNQYEQDLRSWDTFGRISQKQIEWFINTLATTPTEYGVIVASHWVNDNLIKNPVTEPFCKLIGYQRIFTDDTYANNVVVGRPIVKIIDAFISRESGSGSYTQTIKNDVVETINYTYDFTAVDNTVEFICHLNGHTHIDAVGYYKHATNPQLCINISTAQSIYGFVHPYKANGSDCVRGGKGATEDLFNVYGIDREAHTVRIARVGADFSDDGRFRQFIVVPYNSIS